MKEIKLIVKEERSPWFAAQAAEEEANRFLREGWELHSIHVFSASYPGEERHTPEVWTTYTITLVRTVQNID